MRYSLTPVRRQWEDLALFAAREAAKEHHFDGDLEIDPSPNPDGVYSDFLSDSHLVEYGDKGDDPHELELVIQAWQWVDEPDDPESMSDEEIEAYYIDKADVHPDALISWGDDPGNYVETYISISSSEWFPALVRYVLDAQPAPPPAVEYPVATNPWSGCQVTVDVATLTQEQLDAYAVHMDDEEREAINDGFDHDPSPGEWLSAWAERVGPEKAGMVILGS